MSTPAAKCPYAEGLEIAPQVVKVPEKFDSHPGGQYGTLSMARVSKVPDYHFLMYHLGFDLDGKITEECKKRNVQMPSRGPFFDDLHEAAQQVLKDHPMVHYGYVAYCLFLTVLIPVLIFFWEVSGPSYIFDCVLALSIVSYMFNIFHMRHHKGGNLYHNDFLNWVTSPLYEFMDNVYGIHPRMWIANHQDSHHMYTNHMTLDHDVEQPFPVLRLNPHEEYKAFHAFQSYYAPIVFAFVTVSYPFDNLIKWRSNPLYFVSAVILNLLVPWYVKGNLGLWHAFLMYAGSGLMMAYLFQVSHNHVGLGDKQQPISSIDLVLKRQVEESVSWGGFLAGLVFGGINFQTEHHLCPAHDSLYYYYMRPAFMRVCQKHGVRYTYENSFPSALVQYHTALSALAAKPMK